jgi:hypothetical protein
MPDSGWKPVVWKGKTPKQIRRADGKTLKGSSSEQPQPLLKIREEPQGEIIVDADERNTIRHVMRVGAEQPADVKTWEEKKQEIVDDLDKRIRTHELSNDELDDCINMNVDVREV